MFKFFLGGGGNQEKTDDVNGGGGDPLDLQALPEGCTTTLVSLTTPRDAGMMSSISRSFRSPVESDVVWDKFLPPPDPHYPVLLLTPTNWNPTYRPPESSGTLYISTKQVVWLSDVDREKGYTVDFLSISLHAVSRDSEAYTSPCIYT
ncbi:hypothetical protein FF1_001367 [Malus domestica]|uniref:F-box protein PP2-B1-like n=1 Tax=Malus domestica TaxID=3750 RepID=UPI0010AA829D|nr:F-box protein PP2-B1-like [Malus domestica]